MARVQAAGLPTPPPIDDKNPNKIFQSALMAKLSDPARLDNVIESLVKKAEDGNLKAIGMIRDSTGEKPAPSRAIPDMDITVTFGSEGARGTSDVVPSPEEVAAYGD